MQSEQEVQADLDTHQQESPDAKTKTRPIEFYNWYCEEFPWEPECKIYEL